MAIKKMLIDSGFNFALFLLFKFFALLSDQGLLEILNW
jgi:hypothetical protein